MKDISVLEQDNVDLISIEMPGVVNSVYKPPNEKFVRPALGYGKERLNSGQIHATSH